MSAVFTQKHYEYVAAQLHARHPRDQQTRTTLCKIFERDNPKFKRGLFLQQCEDGVQPPAPERGRS